MEPKAILQRLEEIERRANKATPGPWTWEDYSAGWSIVYARVLRKAAGKYQICDFAMHDDAEFIAGCRDDTSWLCELARKLLAIAEATRELLDFLPDNMNGEDWGWAWDQLYADSQEQVKKVRERARKALAALENEHAL